jgi:peptidoglycan/xylan/chitin deacetylase (PgdA/CDA1 family)
MLPPRIVTTSWDDGDPLDLKVAELLRARGLPGTFYFPFIGHQGRCTLEPAHLRSLASEGFEVGGHGMSHSVLPPLRSKEIAREVGICKNRLEGILGTQVRMFCYPKGRFNAAVARHVKNAGYEGARTTRMLRQRLDFDPFQMPTSLLAYPNKRKIYAKNLIKGRNIRGLLDYVTQFMPLDNWVSMGKILFDQVLKEGGVWHLYGHSWQIEEMGLWDELRQMLDYVSNREGVTYVSNRGVLNFLPANKAPVSVNHLIPSK